jgi:cytoskeletal protein RodZ
MSSRREAPRRQTRQQRLQRGDRFTRVAVAIGLSALVALGVALPFGLRVANNQDRSPDVTVSSTTTLPQPTTSTQGVPGAPTPSTASASSTTAASSNSATAGPAASVPAQSSTTVGAPG